MDTAGTATITVTEDNQREFAIDTSFEPYRREAFRHRSIPAQRENIATDNISGEGMVNPDGTWRRGQVDWSMGAGQQYLDLKRQTAENRFYQSKGIDVFGFPMQATLLPDVERMDALTPSGNLRLARCSDYVVVVNNVSVYFYDENWDQTTCSFSTALYGGLAPSVIRDIATNDTYCYLATDTGIWFCQIGVSSVFGLYSASDVTTGYTLGFDMVSWANNQLVASSHQNLSDGLYGNNLYAFQPRSVATFPTFGDVPSVGNVSYDIALIQVFETGDAIVQTKTAHHLSVGQPVTIQNSKTLASVASVSVAGGLVTCVCVSSHGLTVGEVVTVRLSYTNRHVITETATVSGVTNALTFSFATGKITTGTNVLSGTATGSGNYGYNADFTVASVPSFPTATITAASPSTPAAGYVEYTTSAPHGFSPGDSVEIVGVSPDQYSGIFTVDSVPTSSTLVIVNTFTSAATVSGAEAIGLATFFTIKVPTTSAYQAMGGNLISSTPPDLLFTHPNPNHVWTDATSGETQIYFGGYVKSPAGNGYSGCVYRSDLLGSSTTTETGVQTITNSVVAQPWALDTPVQALPMSPDEYPTCVTSYLNYIFVGTNRGIRMCQTLSIYDPTATATGDLKSGPLSPNILQPVQYPVTAIVGDGRYVWFAWNDYDSSSTGLGKLDLSTNIEGDALAPAYASDLMVPCTDFDFLTGVGVINSLDWDPVKNVPVLAVGGVGVFEPYATNEGGNLVVSQYVPSGTLTSGIFDYGISDPKIPLFFDFGLVCPASTEALAAITYDPGDSFGSVQSVGPYLGGGPSELTLAAFDKGNQFQVSLTLQTSNTALSPTLHRWTLKAWPAVVAGTNIMMVIQNFGENRVNGQIQFVDPYDNFIWLENLRQAQTVVTYSEGPLSVLAVIALMDWLPHADNGVAGEGYRGDIVVTLTTLGPYVYTPVATQ